MAEAMRNWRTWLVAGALWLGACEGVCAQTVLADPAPLRGIQIQAPPSGSLAGRLTDLQSAPLAGVSVIFHNQATGAEVRVVTGKNGGFRISELEAGEYTLQADAPQLGHGRLEGIVVTGGTEARVQAASLLRNQTGTYSYSTVASFISDALAFEKFGFAGALDPRNPHKCGTSNTRFGSQP